MARIGSVGAAVVGSEPESWYALQVFDDGWVEVLGSGRSAAGAREQLRGALVALGTVAALFAIAAITPYLGLDEQWSGIVGLVLGIVVVTVLVLQVVRQRGRLRRRLADARADWGQLQRARAAGQGTRRVPGAPTFKRATSAEQLAGWLTPVRLVRAAEVAQLTLTTHGEDAVAVATFTDGTARSWRSPDHKLHEFLGRVDLVPGVVQRVS
ncbi:hypothetical protein [Pseudactinotalea terrae]|uniref:hypothetical protein n=1 Tax=Pseudactinotalea terrae TaxID=1743262 RepID=UPI0012E191A3|nr:hypothetical protein [Pseudactinotalea terrae]